MDKTSNVCCDCADRYQDSDDDDEQEERPVIQPPASPKATPVVPSLAHAVGYRPPTASRYNRLDDFRQYAVYHIDDESDSDDDDGFRQTTLASSSSSYDEDEW